MVTNTGLDHRRDQHVRRHDVRNALVSALLGDAEMVLGPAGLLPCV